MCIYLTNFESQTIFVKDPGDFFLRDQACILNKYSCGTFFYMCNSYPA